jgi:hypothetical protein
METNIIERNLRQFHGTEEYHKHLFPGKSPLLLTDGCKYIRDDLKAFWLFDAILTYQNHKSLRDVNFQIWELKQLKKDFTWLLTCREDTGKRPLISQTMLLRFLLKLMKEVL